jgi:hypothetical protein
MVVSVTTGTAVVGSGMTVGGYAFVGAGEFVVVGTGDGVEAGLTVQDNKQNIRHRKTK